MHIRRSTLQEHDLEENLHLSGSVENVDVVESGELCASSGIEEERHAASVGCGGEVSKEDQMHDGDAGCVMEDVLKD